MKRTLFIVSILAVSLHALAIPAKREGRWCYLSATDSVMLYLVGNEFAHHTEDAFGTWYELQDNNYYAPVEKPAFKERSKARRKARRHAPQQAYPLNIAPRGLVILANYKDTMFLEKDSLSSMQQMLNGEDYTFEGAVGSARQYFINQSNGKYKPQFDVVGPVNLPQEMSYYGENSRIYPYDDRRADSLIAQACRLADRDFDVDFSLYDNDKDGKVDFVFVIYAGYGEADSDIAATIWPHYYTLYDDYQVKVVLDGKIINAYACCSERQYTGTSLRRRNTEPLRCGIGTFCHEFSHVLGLPDLYDTEGDEQKTLGYWDILDAGPYNNKGRTPPAYSAYERFYLGWLTPEIIEEGTHEYQLKDLQTSNTAMLYSNTLEHNLIGNDPDPATFYLLENRMKHGWDAYLPGEGMIITRIRYDYYYWLNNEVNNYTNWMMVDLLEADGRAPKNNYGKAGDAFPAGSNEYQISGLTLTNIELNDSIISFTSNAQVAEKLQDNLSEDEQIIAIYNLLGQPQPLVGKLPEGIYIICTNQSTKKVYIK